jgi:hypothetical protein
MKTNNKPTAEPTWTLEIKMRDAWCIMVFSDLQQAQEQQRQIASTGIFHGRWTTSVELNNDRYTINAAKTQS